jgi:hypothetical protein
MRGHGQSDDEGGPVGETEGNGAVRHAQGGVMPARRHANGAEEAQACSAPSSEEAFTLATTIAGLVDLDADQLRLQWRNHLGGTPPSHLPRRLLTRVLAYRLQAAAMGDIGATMRRIIRQPKGGGGDDSTPFPFVPRDPATPDGVGLKPGALLVREWSGRLERVMVLDKGFAWNGKTYGSLSQIAKAMTGTNWNGHRFFGLRTAGSRGGQTTRRPGRVGAAAVSDKNLSQSLPNRRPSAIVAIASEATVEQLGATPPEAVCAAPPALAPLVVPDDELRGALPLTAS